MIRKTIFLALLFTISSAHAVVGGSVVIMNHGIHGSKVAVKDNMNRIIGYKKIEANEVRYFDSSNRYLGKCEIKNNKESCYDIMNRKVPTIDFPK